jgi:hypothetical protein
MNFSRGSVDFMLATATCKRLLYAESFELAHKARVVEWQTRTFEGRMPKGMRVQVPPRAPMKIRFSGAEVNSLLTPQPKARTEFRKAARGRARNPKAPRNRKH